MNELKLYNNKLTELTESDLTALCHLNEFEPNELEYLDLDDNKLGNLDFITSNTPFINLKTLIISDNPIKNINNIKYLTNLTFLNINSLKLDNEKKTVEILKNIKKLKNLYCYKTFKNYTIKQFKKVLPNIKNIYK